MTNCLSVVAVNKQRTSRPFYKFAATLIRCHDKTPAVKANALVWKMGEMANTISGNARTEFGSEFIISPPQIVESAPSVSYLPRDRQSYITPFTWRGYKAVIGICIA